MEYFVAESDLSFSNLAQEVSEKSFSKWSHTVWSGLQTVLLWYIGEEFDFFWSLSEESIRDKYINYIEKEDLRNASSLVMSHEEHFEQNVASLGKI